MKTLYTDHATSVAGRDGYAKTDDGSLSVTLSRPGSGKPGTNPEQLFACGYSACFGGALEFAAKQKGIAVAEIKIESTVNLNQDDNGFNISVVLNIILQGVDGATSHALVNAAHGICPYSKATRGNIDVTLQVDGQPLDMKAAA